MPLLSRIKVRTRLQILTGVLCGLLLLVAIVAITGFTSIRSAYRSAQVPRVESNYVTYAYQGWQQADGESKMYAALAALHDSSQTKLMAATWQQVLQGRAQANKYVALLQKAKLSKPSKRIVSQLVIKLALYNGYVTQMYSTVSSLPSMASSPAADLLIPDAVRFVTVDDAGVSNAVQASFRTLRTRLDGEESVISARIPGTTNNRLLAMIVISVIAQLLAMWITWVMVRSITKPLQKVTAAANRFAQGDIDIRLDVVGRDGLSKVARSFRETVASQQELADGMSELLVTLQELERGLIAMQAGDLTVGVDAQLNPITPREGHDSVGFLAERYNEMLVSAEASLRAYNAMRKRVMSMLNEISNSSETLSAASAQMASTSEETGRAIAEIADAVGSVAQGAEQQVQSVDDARRLTAELAEASSMSAVSANEAAAAAAEARALAREGVVAADNAAGAMRSVHDSSADVSDAIQALGEKSDQIGGIVATITGIAAQTNLLALNAAIEAARAGEHGRGFAVVAEEVRHLAEGSQHAAASIGGLIEEIQQETARAVEVVELGAAQTHGGVETVEQARQAFLRIGESVEDMSARVEQIASAVRQIAASGDQMRDSMNSVAAVAQQSSASTEEVSASTQQTSASTQEIAASAQQLADTAEELEKLVGQFVLV